MEANTAESRAIYESALQARQATSNFYAQTGFQYTHEQVRAWMEIYLPQTPKAGAVLNHCCSDGICTMCQTNRLHGIEVGQK